MKPTDIWHNIPMQFRPICRNGDKCHESAPRGSRTGTQGLSGSVDRSKIPHELCYDIYKNVNLNIEEKIKQTILINIPRFVLA